MSWCRAAAPLFLAVALVGCKGGGAIGLGEGLYHDLQGGKIAEDRPPPPGMNDPFPKIGTVPARPAAPDIVAQQRLSDQLAAQRDRTEQAAAADPLRPVVAPPIPKPNPAAAAAPNPDLNRVVVDAAPAPSPVAPQPRAGTATTPVPTPPTTVAAVPPVPGLSSVPAVMAAVAAGPLPALANQPPATPVGFGSVPAAPGAAAAAATPLAVPAIAQLAIPAAPAPPPARSLTDILTGPPPPPPKGNTIYTPPAIPTVAAVTVAFTPGSANLPPSAPLELRRFVLTHRGAAVTVTGHGEQTLPTPDAQSRALDLALRRAQAIAAALGTAGVPAANLHLRAEAAGQGGTASL